VKRLASYWLRPFQFDENTRSGIEQLLGEAGKATVFLQAIAEECSHYIEGIKAEVPRREIQRWRKAIERADRHATALATAIRSLDADCLRLIEMGYALETKRPWERAATLDRLDEFSRVCGRVTAFRELRPSEGNPVDRDRRRLAAACAEAYQRATGQRPSSSPNGVFASVLLEVMHAVRGIPQSQTSVGADFLRSAISRNER
jgi:hypothetical protein